MKNKTPCTIKDECGACSFVNLDYKQSLFKKVDQGVSQLKENKLLENTQLLRPVPSPRQLGYRTVFKLAVRKNPNTKSKNPFQIGLFKKGTHDIGPSLAACPLHVPLLRKLLKELIQILPETGLTPFEEKNQEGDLRYVIARTNHSASELMITWVVTSDKQEDLIRRLNQSLVEKGFPLRVSSMNINFSEGNAIWGEKNVLLSPQNYILENFSHFNLKLGPTSFYQVNPWQAENIYLRIQSIAKSKKNRSVAWDLFSGVGPISLVLASCFERVLSIEENKEAVKLNYDNAEINHVREKILPVEGLTESVIGRVPEEFSSPQLIVANPSRRGIHSQARKTLKKLLLDQPTTELLYLSCDTQSFGRDLQDFKKDGIELTELQGFDMHAQTDQVEWLGRLKKCQS